MKNTSLLKITKIAIFAALSAVFMIFTQFPIIPAAPFLKYDPSDIPALIVTFAMGPLSGVCVVAVKEIIFALMRFNAHDVIGIPMDFIASGTFVFVSGFIYHKKKTKLDAVTALVCGAVIMTVVMSFLNYFIVPVYMKLFVPGFNISSGKLIKIIIAGVIPFNLIKGAINSIVTFFVYKRMSKRIRGQVLTG